MAAFKSAGDSDSVWDRSCRTARAPGSGRPAAWSLKGGAQPIVRRTAIEIVVARIVLVRVGQLERQLLVKRLARERNRISSRIAGGAVMSALAVHRAEQAVEAQVAQGVGADEFPDFLD